MTKLQLQFSFLWTLMRKTISKWPITAVLLHNNVVFNLPASQATVPLFLPFPMPFLYSRIHADMFLTLVMTIVFCNGEAPANTWPRGEKQVFTITK